MNQDMERLYVRHPSDVPIAWSLDDVAIEGTEYLKNVSEGGLAFLSISELALGSHVDIQIPAIDPQVLLKGVVVWCAPVEDRQFEIGVRFIDGENQFRMRMVEQICHIEHYKREILETEGRVISGEAAALEWIARYAKDFPQ